MLQLLAQLHNLADVRLEISFSGIGENYGGSLGNQPSDGRQPVTQRGGRGGAAEQPSQQGSGFLDLLRVVGGLADAVSGGHIHGHFAAQLEAILEFGVVDGVHGLFSFMSFCCCGPVPGETHRPAVIVTGGFLALLTD